ncbi:uncharacterized protein [Littorina saxatilis]|uniref:uncharacterized protein n=1 Tax=Littorina saxatilis TaxID=31220 RepID=UPI0038B507AE
MGVTAAVMLMLIATHTHAWSSKKVCKYDEWLNKPCSAQADCKVKKAECFKGRCLCTPGYNYSISGNTCVEVPWLERSCASDADCPDGIHAECFKGKCLCTLGYYYSNGQAVCVDNCPVSDQQAEFLTYPDSILGGNNDYLFIFSVTLVDCLAGCVADTRCIVAQYDIMDDACTRHTVSPLADTSNFIIQSLYRSLYQQRCK